MVLHKSLGYVFIYTFIFKAPLIFLARYPATSMANDRKIVIQIATDMDKIITVLLVVLRPLMEIKTLIPLIPYPHDTLHEL